MTNTSWWQFLLAVLVFPPAGIVLLWMRRGLGVFKKILGSLAIAALGVVQLFVVYGMRIEMDGSGMGMIVSFGKPEKLQSNLEEHRAKQKEAPANPSFQPASSPAGEALPATDAGERSADRASTPATSAAWPEFRGTGRDGHYTGEILTHWPDKGLAQLWKQPVGGGYASLAIADGRAFTIEQRRNQEVVAAYDLKSGQELWTNAWNAHFQESMGGDGPRATPTWDEGRLYALGAEGELRVMDAATGKTIWSKNILKDNGASNIQWGMAASPLIVDNKVIVLPGGSGGKSVVAYDKMTGEPVWKALDDKQAYTSPMLAMLAGQRQLVVVSGERILGMSPSVGTLLWSYPWKTDWDINSAQPIVVDGDHVLVSAGYDHGSALLKITATEKGFSATPVWENKNLKNRFNSSVLHNGYVYGFDESVFACIDARSGERKWKGGRYGYGQVLLAGEHLIVLTESGDVVLVRATPEAHQELAKFSAIEGKTWNLPAIAEGVLLVRNAREIAAYRIGK